MTIVAPAAPRGVDATAGVVGATGRRAVVEVDGAVVVDEGAAVVDVEVEAVAGVR